MVCQVLDLGATVTRSKADSWDPNLIVHLSCAVNIVRPANGRGIRPVRRNWETTS